MVAVSCVVVLKMAYVTSYGVCTSPKGMVSSKVRREERCRDHRMGGWRRQAEQANACAIDERSWTLGTCWSIVQRFDDCWGRGSREGGGQALFACLLLTIVPLNQHAS